MCLCLYVCQYLQISTHIFLLGFRKNLHDNPADFFLDKITAVEQGLNVPRQYKASDGTVHNGVNMYLCMHHVVVVNVNAKSSMHRNFNSKGLGPLNFLNCIFFHISNVYAKYCFH